MNVIDLLIDAEHHVLPHKVDLMGPWSDVMVAHRFGLVRTKIQAALSQLERLKKVAENKGYDEILEILSEKVQF